MTRRFRVLAVLAFMVTALGAGVTAAEASHSAKERVSVGQIGGNGAFDAFFEATSADGARALFTTDEKLVSADTDASFDLYERQGGGTTLLSIGPGGGNGASDVFFSGASADATQAFFETDESLVSGDTDTFYDVYMRAGGVTTLMSVGPTGGNGPSDVLFHEVSRDGSAVFFETDEQLTSSDSDAELDLYMRSGGTTTHVSTGPDGGNGAFAPSWGGTTYDGSAAFFETMESLLSTDTDGSWDVYKRSGGTTTLVSTGPSGGNGNADAGYRDNSVDGAHVFFHTAESLVGTDTDTHSDVYDRAGSTTTLLSTGPAGGNGALPATFEAASEDGTRVLFSTNEVLTSSDTDAVKDVYRRSGTTTDHVSTGPAGGNAPIDANLRGVSADATRAYIETEEALVATDTDTGCAVGQAPSCTDVYEYAGGTTTRVSAPGNGAFDANFAAVSRDGTRVFFDTREVQATSDTDSFTDVYERFSSTTTHISIGPDGGNGSADAFMLDASWLSGDGTRAFFDTTESLISSDTDSALDIYSATFPTYPRPNSALRTRAALVPAFAQCTSPNRTHGPPLASPSCSPPAGTSSQATTAAGFNGYVSYKVDPGATGPPEDSDVRIAASLADVRCVSTGGNCGAANATGAADYTGELRATVSVRMTDRWNAVAAGGGDDPGTIEDTTVDATFPCATTGTSTGSACALDTTANALVPGLVKDEKRAIWQLGQARIYDGGPDGNADTPAGDTLYAVQGIFIP
jgi:hypothetical protein